VRVTVPDASALAETVAQAAAMSLRNGQGLARAERAALDALWSAVDVETYSLAGP